MLRTRTLVASLEEEPDINPATDARQYALQDPDSYAVMISALH